MTIKAVRAPDKIKEIVFYGFDSLVPLSRIKFDYTSERVSRISTEQVIAHYKSNGEFDRLSYSEISSKHFYYTNDNLTEIKNNINQNTLTIGYDYYGKHLNSLIDSTG